MIVYNNFMDDLACNSVRYPFSVVIGNKSAAIPWNNRNTLFPSQLLIFVEICT